ncbi:MAG: hypothetical protein WCF84_12150, partial [Anaerolineae bacterium]
ASAPAATAATPSHTAPARLAISSQVQVKADLLQNQALPPGACQWRLTLHNAGNVLDTFSFSVQGIAPEWARIDPVEVSLSPNEQATAVLTVTPRDDTMAGDYPFVLRSYSHVNVSTRTDINLKLHIPPRGGFRLDFPIPEIQSQGEAYYAFSLVGDPITNIDIEANLTASDEGNACEYAFEAKRVLIPARLTVTHTLVVRPKALLAPSEQRQYTIHIVATPIDPNVPPHSAEIRLNQQGAAPVNLILRPQQQPGEMEANYTITLTNPVEERATLILSGQDEENACDYIFEPPQVLLEPKKQATSQLRLVCRDYFDGPGDKTITFSVLATRQGDQVPAARIQGRLMQKPTMPVALTLVPGQQSSPAKARFFIEGHNPRAVSLRALLGAKDDADSLIFSFSPSEIHFSPRAESRAELIVTPKDRLMSGEQRRVHQFTVIAEVDGHADPVTIQGTLAQIHSMTLWDYLVLAFRWTIWILEWVALAVILIFIATVLLAAYVHIADPVTNPSVFVQVNPILNVGKAKEILNWSPFAGIATSLIELLSVMMDNVSGLTNGGQ